MARQYGNSQVVHDNTDDSHEQLFKKIRVASTVILFLVGIGFALASSIYGSTIDNAIEEKMKEYDSQSIVYTKLNDSLEDDVKVVEVDAVINSAKESGQKVCDLQNNLIRYNKEEADSPVMSKEHENALKELRTFIPKVSTNKDETRNSWTYFGEWVFENTYDFKGTTVPVVWSCYADAPNGNRYLIACVTGKYDANDKTFSEMQLNITSWYSYIASLDIDSDDEETVSENDVPATDTDASTEESTVEDENATTETTTEDTTSTEDADTTTETEGEGNNEELD